MTDPFAAIRPYRDDEVQPVLRRLLASPDFLNTMAGLRFRGLAGRWPALLRPLIRWRLRSQFGAVDSVHGFQMVVKGYLEAMILRTTAGFSVSGLDALDPSVPYLFVSNHRDIAMDPAFTNFALHRSGHSTVRIAIGDNLLTRDWIADLMRLNKSFIVKRSASKPREKFEASRLLSAFIRSSLLEEREPIWIAQREGRAKDGLDRTEPAVIKMLSLSRDKQSESFAEHLASLRLVPVSISYEVDPCDGLKASELLRRADGSGYVKTGDEDVASIGRGIAGHKGYVHAHFGQPLEAVHDSAAAVATAIDAQVIAGYRLYPTSLWAWERLEGRAPPLPAETEVGEASVSREQFDARIDALAPRERDYALAQYANAVNSKLALWNGML